MTTQTIPSPADWVAAKREAEERHWPLKRRIRNMNLFLAGSIGVNLILAIGLVLSKQKPTKDPPYVVAIDANKHVVGLGSAMKGDASTIETVKQLQLQTWIEDIRTVMTDWPAQLKAVERIQNHTAAKAESSMKAWYTDNRPDIRAKSGTVTVVVNNTLKQSDNTYQIEWTETTQDSSAQTIATQRWKGTFTVVIGDPPPNHPEVNPLGFWVTDFNWSPVNL